MSGLADIAESRIQEAIESGEFTSLSGMGKPLDLDAYFASPSSLRAGFGLLKSAGAVPPEVEAMKQVHQLRETIQNSADPILLRQMNFELQARETEIAMAMERMKRSIRQDIAG
ncbi:DUF1992 domain-containing protein [Phragmitibacter flavus]|nr:DUF1992 domain-containing protein [Phragmitibacter flavus]